MCIAFRKLGLPMRLTARPSRVRNPACAVIAARIIRPHTRLSTTRWWQEPTLETAFDSEGAHACEPQAAMDRLLARHDRIQARLARRHFVAGSLLSFDISSSRFECSHCPLARRGYSRDVKKGKLLINFGLLCDVRGRPAAVSVMEGNIAETRNPYPASGNRAPVHDVRAGTPGHRRQPRHDRRSAGRRTAPARRQLLDHRAEERSIKKLIRSGTLQPRRFDDANPFEILHFRRAPGPLPQRAPGRTQHPYRGIPPPGPPKRTSRCRQPGSRGKRRPAKPRSRRASASRTSATR